MVAAFKDIKIAGLDEEASAPREPGSPMFRMHLTLSASAPSAWSQYFNDRWQGHFYMMKRRAEAYGSSIIIECIADELQNDHLPELKKIVADTNTAYRAYCEKQQHERERVAAQEAADKAKVADLKDKLKFD